MADTIFALATPPGKSGVAVIRVSGPGAFAAAEAICGSLPPPRQAGLRRLRHPESGAILDEALVIAFLDGESFTGEKIVEFQIHGSRAVQLGLLAALTVQSGLRQAQPGEFTRRALESGRLDLTQVEGLADLIEAETEVQLRQAVKLMHGGLSGMAADWRVRLTRALALLEVTVDFADEDVPEDTTEAVLGDLAIVEEGLRAESAAVGISERIREGFEVAIVGAPNAGKSTLLNRLAGRDAAITSEVAGTTRDVIEVRMDLDGLPVTLLDTAGLRETDDPVEKIGVTRAVARAAEADLRIFLVDDVDAMDSFGVPILLGDEVVAAKADLGRTVSLQAVSGLTGAGVDELLGRIGQTLASRVAHAGSANRERHREALKAALSALESAMDHVRDGPGSVDLATEDLRLAIRRLDGLMGKVDVENVLDVIFSSFCLGK